MTPVHPGCCQLDGKGPRLGDRTFLDRAVPGILQAMCASIRAFTQPGDGIIVQQPVYLLYARAIANCGRKLVDSPLQLRGDRYEMDFADLEEKMAAPEKQTDAPL